MEETKENKKVEFESIFTKGELDLLNCDMEIKDFGTTTMAELLVFKAERFIDSRIEVPLYYQDDIDSIF